MKKAGKQASLQLASLLYLQPIKMGTGFRMGDRFKKFVKFVTVFKEGFYVSSTCFLALGRSITFIFTGV
jgi:hypothetical protein